MINQIQNGELLVMKKLFVGNLSWETTEETLRPLFETCGQVVKVNVVVDQYTGRSRGFGFVEMDTPEAASRAIAELNDKPLLGRNLRVSLAQERSDRGPGTGGPRSSSGPRTGGGGRDRDSRGGGGGYGGGGGGGSYSGGGGGGGRSGSYRPRQSENGYGE